MNIRKKIAAVLCATALAVTGASVVAPAANAFPSMGTGVVDILTKYTSTYCVAHGFSSGNCGAYSAGIVVANQWSDNEVVTTYDAVAGYAPGDSITIKDPFTGHTEFGYVQKIDGPDNLAVLWIYAHYSVNGFTRSSYTWTTAPITSALDNHTVYGTSVDSEGDAGGDSYINNHPFNTTYGSVTNASHSSIGCYRHYDGGLYTLYNTVVSNTSIGTGDSGGPLINNSFGDPNYQTVVAVLSCNSASGDESIPIHWAIWDMLNTHP